MCPKLTAIENLLLICIVVKGKDMIDKNRAYIVIVNHQHALDVVSVMQVCTDVNIDRRITKYRNIFEGLKVIVFF